MVGLFLWSLYYLTLSYETGETGMSPLLSVFGVPKPVTPLPNGCAPLVVNFEVRGNSRSGGTAHKLQVSKLQWKSNKLYQSQEPRLCLHINALCPLLFTL